ncbi:unnamed protein product, partial [Iphiclides podalirius]
MRNPKPSQRWALGLWSSIKCVDKSRVKHSGAAVDNLITEIRLLKTLTHPHIVQMKEFTWDDRSIYIIMEYCCGGDLSKYIHRYGRVPEKKVLYFLQQLASALKFLREKGVVHMDLKPHNLLLHKGSDGRYTLKVADFGFAQLAQNGYARGLRGSPLYMAPELLRGEGDERVDLWSVGVILYECLFGRAPYSSATFKELVDKIQRQAPIELPPKSSISPGCQDLLSRLLQHDPDRRISYEEFFAHEYLDLEHMPSKENYEKAVGLMRGAVGAEAEGRLAEALEAYGEALRYLLPAAAAEPDALRRAALAAKLSRYMERAEEIKRHLKGEPAKEPSPSINGREDIPPVLDQQPQEMNGEETRDDSNEDVKQCAEKRVGLARLLRRRGPSPSTTLNAPSSTDGQTDKKQKATEDTNDMCKIT